MTGKDKCKILKDIRRQIALDNDIELITEECRYKGKCRGTCPRCEAEVLYLEVQLANRKKLGKAIAITAAASLLIGYAAGEIDTIEEKLKEALNSQLQGAVEAVSEDDEYQQTVEWQ